MNLPEDSDGGLGSRMRHISGWGSSSASSACGGPAGAVGSSGASAASAASGVAGTTGTGCGGGRGWLIAHLQQRPTEAL